MIPQLLTIDPFTAGDWLPGPIVASVTENIPASALAKVTMRLRLAGSRAAAIELSTATGEITLVSGALWQWTIPRQALETLTAGEWRWTIQLTAADGVVDTPLYGILTVLPDV